MKRKAIFLSLVIVSVLMLASIGYAAWAITSNTSGVQAGNFQAYAVDPYNGDIEVKLQNQTVTTQDQITTYSYVDTGSATVIFGKSNQTTNLTPWLSASNDMEGENLTVYFRVDFTGPANTVFDVRHDFYFGTTKVENSSSLAELAKFVDTTPAIATAEGGNGVASNNASYSNGQITFTNNGFIILKVTYSWGSLFGGNNAYTYFNNNFVKPSTKVGLETFEILKYGQTATHGTTITKDVSAAGQFAEAALTALKSYTDAKSVNENAAQLSFKVEVSKHTNA